MDKHGKKGIVKATGSRIAAAAISLPIVVMAATLAVTAKPAGERTRRPPTFVFRNMEMGPNKMPETGNSKSKLGVTTPQTNPQGKSFDLKPNDKGIVSPGPNGMSVTPLTNQCCGFNDRLIFEPQRAQKGTK